MESYTFTLLGILLLSFIYFSRAYKVIYVRKAVLPVISLLFIACLILFSKTSVIAAVRGLNLWLNIVFPSLFPFFVASELLNGTGFVRAAGVLLEPVMRPVFNVPGCSSFAFLMGITSGYPVGAKITAEMRKDKLLTKHEAERLLAFSNNSGPLFIIGAVAVGMFKMPEAGLLLLICHISACITVGVLFRFLGGSSRKSARISQSNFFTRFKAELLSTRQKTTLNFGSAFGNAIKNSISTLLMIGGFIVLFSVIINLLLKTGIIHQVSALLSPVFSPLGIGKDLITSLVSGFFEITTGTSMASSAFGVPTAHKLAAASVVLGWAGLSVHSQVLSIVSSTDMSMKPYLLGKFLQGIISGAYTFILLKISGPVLLSPKAVFSPIFGAEPSSWYDYLFNSFKFLAAAGVILLLCIAAAFIIRRFTAIKSRSERNRNSYPT